MIYIYPPKRRYSSRAYYSVLSADRRPGTDPGTVVGRTAGQDDARDTHD
jgi:hypothetical protein